MKTRKQTFVIALAMILTLTIAPLTIFGQDEANESLRHEGNQIEGVWKNQVTVKDCLSNTVLATFPGLLNYHQGGTMSETGGTNPALRSPGYGIWTRTGGRTYVGKFTFFTFNPDGTLNGSQKINQNIVISRNGNRLTDNATAEIFDADGNLRFTVCATANATRF
jgi:hypothetical protein